jgi:hypothetical protein
LIGRHCMAFAIRFATLLEVELKDSLWYKADAADAAYNHHFMQIVHVDMFALFVLFVCYCPAWVARKWMVYPHHVIGPVETWNAVFAAETLYLLIYLSWQWSFEKLNLPWQQSKPLKGPSCWWNAILVFKMIFCVFEVVSRNEDNEVKLLHYFTN